MPAREVTDASPSAAGGAPGMHVVHVTAPARFGGLEGVVQMLCGGLATRGVRSTVVAVFDEDPSGHPVVSALESAGATVVCVVVGRRAYLREFRTIVRIVRDSAADVVHTHGNRSDVVGGLAAHAVGLPAVSTLHGFTASSRGGAVREWLQLRSLRSFEAVIGVSGAISARAVASGVPPDRVHSIPNAWRVQAALGRLEARMVLGLPPDGFIAGWVGRISREKGGDVFVDALARMPRGMVLASVIGDGSERPSLVARARALGIEGEIRWHGVRHDAAALMRAFDVLVLSSHTEGIPLVLLEAMSAGTPIIATRVGGIPSMLDDSEALLVAAGSAHQLAQAMQAVHDDPASALARAERAARRLTTQFAIEPWLDRHLALYAEVMKGKIRRRPSRRP